MLNMSGETGHPCLAPDLGEKHQYLSSISNMMVAGDIFVNNLYQGDKFPLYL